MKIKLGENMYGKNAVNLSKIIRHADHHEFRRISVNISLEGDFETAYTQGDNTRILPTDTQKKYRLRTGKGALYRVRQRFRDLPGRILPGQ